MRNKSSLEMAGNAAKTYGERLVDRMPLAKQEGGEIIVGAFVLGIIVTGVAAGYGAWLSKVSSRILRTYNTRDSQRRSADLSKAKHRFKTAVSVAVAVPIFFSVAFLIFPSFGRPVAAIVVAIVMIGLVSVAAYWRVLETAIRTSMTRMDD